MLILVIFTLAGDNIAESMHSTKALTIFLTTISNSPFSLQAYDITSEGNLTQGGQYERY